MGLGVVVIESYIHTYLLAIKVLLGTSGTPEANQVVGFLPYLSAVIPARMLGWI